MPLDAICLMAVAEELRAAVLGGKIDKVYQPSRDEVVLAVRGSCGNGKLLLSGSPNHPGPSSLSSAGRTRPSPPCSVCSCAST